jgi:hypothetical protein
MGYLSRCPIGRTCAPSLHAATWSVRGQGHGRLPVRQAAALLRCADKLLWRRIGHYVGEARKLDDMSEVKLVGIDETSLRKGQNYITVVHDLYYFAIKDQ